MSAEQMISLSYVFFVISVILVISVIIMFFVFDIKHCIRSIRKNDMRLKKYNHKYKHVTVGMSTELLEEFIED